MAQLPPTECASPDSDSRKCQTATATPAEPGELPFGLVVNQIPSNVVTMAISATGGHCSDATNPVSGALRTGGNLAVAAATRGETKVDGTTITNRRDASSADFNVSAYGACRDEAINNLAEEITQRTHPDAPRR